MTVVPTSEDCGNRKIYRMGKKKKKKTFSDTTDRESQVFGFPTLLSVEGGFPIEDLSD
jgi:hypothetical protein